MPHWVTDDFLSVVFLVTFSAADRVTFTTTSTLLVSHRQLWLLHLSLPFQASKGSLLPWAVCPGLTLCILPGPLLQPLASHPSNPCAGDSQAHISVPEISPERPNRRHLITRRSHKRLKLHRSQMNNFCFSWIWISPIGLGTICKWHHFLSAQFPETERWESSCWFYPLSICWIYTPFSISIGINLTFHHHPVLSESLQTLPTVSSLLAS